MSARRVRVPPFKACRKCKSLVPREASRCPVCGSTDLSEDWEGTLVVIDPEKSVIAKKLEIAKPGRYAIKVR
ncbi:MAG TPA: DNA-directed RNA polymerase, subunit E'' [Pyrodictium delaneyi]|uniref:Transcription elongation factor Spt4 n=1 Tax=Pyrodictium delaneyi TaxID=1273541 RepID=A0A832ZT43_9CREN|nr:DNA-directed RNA polymerase, subunit E'' [Pyrodictium delaneyi]